MLLAKVSPQAGKDQNGKTSAVKAPRRDMKNFKNVDSKLANLILNEIVDRYFFLKMPRWHLYVLRDVVLEGNCC